MTKYIATINVPGYLPDMAEESAVFDTATEAWAWLAEERERHEDDYSVDADWSDGRLHSETHYVLYHLSRWIHRDISDSVVVRYTERGCGTVYGPIPGYEGGHDLGIAYSVDVYID